uniref:THAP-type domain-containing protein n=1 Tax=Gouania willdenowi TaxID=441366 RepID=A0A8C5ETQ5_GOUWI
MPVFCAAFGCNNRCSSHYRSLVLEREGFVASDSSKLCSEHFKPDDFDRTGQIVRLRDGATPSVINFPCNFQRVGVFFTLHANR